MKYPKHAKRKLFTSFLCILLCISMLLGSTYAWFTDRVSTKNNIITSGNLDLEMYWTDDPSTGVWNNVEEDAFNTIFSYDNWEPGYTDVKYIKLVNKGELALNYDLTIANQGAVGKLAEVINVYFSNEAVSLSDRSDLDQLSCIGLLSNVMNGGSQSSGTLLPEGAVSLFHPSGEVVVTLAMTMITSAGNEYQNESSGEFTIKALATQAPWESDSFGADYDSTAEMPITLVATNITVPVTPTAEGTVGAEGLEIVGPAAAAYLPEGVKLVPGITEVTFSITPKDTTASGLSVVNDEILIPVDVHIEGVAEDNTVPIIIDLGAVLPKDLNMGNYKLVHVEDDGNKLMTQVSSRDLLVAHNQFVYTSATGQVSVCMANFSEVVLSADIANPWHGGLDYSWFIDGENNISPSDGNDYRRMYTIRNADQLYAFSKLLGSMHTYDQEWTKLFNGTYHENDFGENGCTEKSTVLVDGYGRNIIKWGFNGHTVSLVNDIDLNGGSQQVTVDGKSKTRIFYPIGYYNNTAELLAEGESPVPIVYDRDDGAEVKLTGVYSSVKAFRGTFAGNGHTISNFYQNTWDMFGDYNDGYSGTPNYYKDAMGLFGYLYGATITSLTIDHFSCDGEFTPTGVLAAYAAAAADSEAKGNEPQPDKWGYDQGETTIQGVMVTNCNPRVYNTGNGGIVGIAGNDEDVYKAEGSSTSDSTGNKDWMTDKCRIVFNGVTVDESNKISALWGSWDVACGGLMGMFRGRSRVVMTNCSVSAQIDVYNDVCGNYQYYWYRYAGMLIGSLRRRNIEVNGYIMPDMENIAAFGTTVQLDKWNDYYYCELVANSLASYTHDHQFSRLEEVQSVDPQTMKYVDLKGASHNIPKEGWAHYVVALNGERSTENAVCYHFNNGKVHNHDDYNGDGVNDYETVNGESILVENNRHIYLPFDQLFQGDGWGVKHIALTDVKSLENIWPELKGITILTRDSDYLAHVKFDSKYETSLAAPLYLAKDSKVFAGQLFKVASGEKVQKNRVVITMDLLGDDGEGIKNLSDHIKAYSYSNGQNADKSWTDHSITFETAGLMKITIQDYEYCKPTYLYVQVVDEVKTFECDHCGRSEQFKPLPLGDLTTGHYYLAGDMTANQAINITGDVVIHLNGKNVTFPESAAFTVSGRDNILSILGDGKVTGAGNETAVISAADKARLKLYGGTYGFIETAQEGAVVAPAVISCENIDTNVLITQNVTVTDIVYATEDSVITLQGKITNLKKGIDLTENAILGVQGMLDGSKVIISADGVFTNNLGDILANRCFGYFQAADGYKTITQINYALKTEPVDKETPEQKLARAEYVQSKENQYWIEQKECPMCGATNVTWKKYNNKDVYHANNGHWIISAAGTAENPVQNNNIVYAAEGKITMCVMLDMSEGETYYSTGRFLLRPGNTLNVMGNGHVTSNGKHENGNWGDLGLFTMVGRRTTLNLYGGTYTYTGGYKYKSVETGDNVVDYPKYALINSSVSSSELNIFDRVTIGNATYGDKENYNLYIYGTLNMFGGTIQNGISETHVVGSTENETRREASGNITLGRGAVMNLYGGTITGGKTGHRGGNILMRDYSTLNVYGGTITGGKAIDEDMTDGVAAGGNIATNEYSSFITLNIAGGEISNGLVKWGENDAAIEQYSHLYAGGGNIYLNGGKSQREDTSSTVQATISAGKIYGGEAGSGGNIYIRNGAQMTISGGEIYDGNARMQGGNINVFNFADMTISGGEIYDGTSRSGGNINIGEKSGERAYLKVTGGEIYGGEAVENGGNLRVYGASILDIQGGTFTGGQAVNGGNVFNSGAETTDENGKVTSTVQPISLKISGGTFTGGKATTYGGNLYVYDQATMEITGGNFIGGLTDGSTNAIYGGNIAVSKQSELTITGATIKGGQTTSSGGNVYAGNSSQLTVNAGTTIEGGRAFSTYIADGKTQTAGQGGNIHIAYGTTLTMNDGAVIGGYSRLGGNIAVGSDGEATTTAYIKGGTISGGQATVNGGNMLVSYRSDVTISGGEIYGGELPNSTNAGINFYVGLVSKAENGTIRKPKLTISGGTITGAIEIAGSQVKDDPEYYPAEVILSGTPQILGDTEATWKCGIRLASMARIDISKLQSGAKINIAMYGDTGAFTKPDANAESVMYCFTPYNANCVVELENNILKLVKK